MDIAKKCQEIARIITRLALETILKEMTYTAIFLVVILTFQVYLFLPLADADASA